MFGEILEKVRKAKPLVHCITNYVTVNDCANILLAIGASPIMADDAGEAADITSICHSLTINIGTLNRDTIPSMLAAGKRANELGHPVVLDPVGAGASALRTQTALMLLREIRFAVIRGNISEIRTLALGTGTTKGVDADASEAVTEETLDREIEFTRAFSAKTGAVIVMTGAIDIAADEHRAICIRNGHPMMSRVTGTGCMLSALTAACLAAHPSDHLLSASAAVCAMGLCGEFAFGRLTAPDGNSAYRGYLIDAVFHMTAEKLDRGAKYEVRS